MIKIKQMIKTPKNYDAIVSKGTGSCLINNFQIKEIKIDRYSVIVQLTDDNKFVGISEVKINSPDLWHRNTPISFVDVNDEYPE